MPEHVSTCAIRQDIAKKRGLKKYGFHGLSCKFVLHSNATENGLTYASAQMRSS